MLELHLIFRGNVQGVGFRAAAKRKAEELNLTGYAKNLPDESVEIIVQGKEADIIAFQHYLRSTFHPSEILEEQKTISQTYSQFNIF